MHGRRAGRRVFGLIVGLVALAAGSAWAQAPAAVEPPAAESASAPALTPAAARAPRPDVAGERDEPTDPAAEVRRLHATLLAVAALLAGGLILLMQAGFALVEAGLCRSKNVAHSMGMNLVVFALGVLAFWAVGYAVLAGGLDAGAGPGAPGGLLSVRLFGVDWGLAGARGFFLTGLGARPQAMGWFLTQALLLNVAATVPTGALAERWRFGAFCLFGLVLAGLIYPAYGCWVWGGGWLAGLGRGFGLGNGVVDFAGSGVVHLTGGVAALAGAVALGPRIGKFNPDGSSNAIPGHDVRSVVLGTLLLAVGWLGFNAAGAVGGSVPVAGSLDRLASVAACTVLASASGCLAATLYTWAVFGRPDPTMGCNGLLGGAVAVGASCAFLSPTGAVIVGAAAGVLVIWSVLFLERVLRVDDPVGAVSVHGTCGAWGCLAVGLFADGEFGRGWNGVPGTAPLGLFYGGDFTQLAAQALGVLANVAWVYPTAALAFFLIGKTVGNRVAALTEVAGLDVREMGVAGYVPEDTIAVQVAGQEYLSAYGPGVPGRKPADRP